MKKTFILASMAAFIVVFSACYKNYYDVSDTALKAINTISFRNDVVPIVTAGGCGCHNNGSTRQIAFKNGDTVFYSAILTRSGMLSNMAKGGAHPGEGSIFFTPSQKVIINKWVEQGAKDDYVPPPIVGDITYAQHIIPLYKTDCKGGSCHGGAAITLDYTIFKAKESVIKPMMNSQGSSGHPGGAISIAPATAATFLAWIAQGYKP